jgi:hypothetical protein
MYVLCVVQVLSCGLVPQGQDQKAHKGYGFVEFGSEREVKDAINNMNNFVLMDRPLKVSVIHPGAFAADLNGPLVMASGCEGGTLGEGDGPAPAAAPLALPAPVATPQLTLQQPAPTGGMGAAPAVSGAVHPQRMAMINAMNNLEGKTTPQRCVVLRKILPVSEVDPDLGEEIKEECVRFGPVRDTHVQTIQEKDEVNVFVLFLNPADAATAQKELDNRYFGGRIIRVDFYSEYDFMAQNFTKLT